MRRATFFPLLSLFLISLLSSCGGSGGGGESTSSTGAAPIATSVAATSITENNATLNGTINPNGLATQAWFEYGTDPGLQTYSSSPNQDAGNGLIAQSVSTTLSVLAPGTTYYFRVCAENSGGYSEGQVMSFTTASPGSPPAVTTIAATSIGATGATLNGSVIPNGLATNAWFEYGTDPGLQTYSSSPNQDAGNGLIAQSVSTTLSVLAPGATYYFRVCAENSGGYSEGQVMSFTTASPGSPPAVTTIAATSIGATGATLNGSVIPNGLATDAWFEWGTDPTLAGYSTTETQAVGSGTTSQTIHQALTGLATGTIYYYRVAASNATGPANGSIASFTTASLLFFGVVSTTPTDNATEVPLGSTITVTFNKDVDVPTLVGAITVSSFTGDLPGGISYNSTTKTATFTPAAPFAPLTDYTVTVAAKVKSHDGFRLSEPYIFGFKTGSAF